jgi:hypothetical protein
LLSAQAPIASAEEPLELGHEVQFVAGLRNHSRHDALAAHSHDPEVVVSHAQDVVSVPLPKPAREGEDASHLLGFHRQL